MNPLQSQGQNRVSVAPITALSLLGWVATRQVHEVGQHMTTTVEASQCERLKAQSALFGERRSLAHSSPSAVSASIL